MDRLLVIGLSGQVGEALRAQLQVRGLQVLAISRSPRDDSEGLQWRLGSLEHMPALDGTPDAILSLGPLDAFTKWYADARPASPRVIALSSTGRRDKLQSADAAERALAERLADAEARLAAAAESGDAALTLLRPSLVYGGTGDRSLSPMLARARRWGMLPLPARARGLRQPVHAADVAAGVLACLDHPATAGRAYDLPGGETLAFDEMVRRTLERHAPGARLIRLPGPVFALALGFARWLDPGAPGAGVISRLELDQVADPGPAQRDFGYAPRLFQP